MMATALTLDYKGDDTGGLEAVTDSDLLKRFLAGDEASFTALVQRHASLVLNVCHRILRQSQDAEDAFQATFLVLARKCRSLEWQDSIAGWLHQTARRTALKLRGMSLTRRTHETQAVRQAGTEIGTLTSHPATQAALQELGEILDAELADLPPRFREVILLTQVEGLSRDEVASRLGISIPAVKDRLERGREQLRSRLLRKGVALPAGLLAAWLLPGTAQAASLTTLAVTTSQTASAFAMGTLAAGTLPTATTLAQGVLQMMGLEKLKAASAWIVAFLTAGGIAFGMLKDDPTRFEKGLRGRLVSIQTGSPSTVTVSLEEFETLLNLDVSKEAKVWMAFEAGQLTDLQVGQQVSLRLGDDHRTVNEIHIQGRIREASIRSVAASGKLTIADDDDGDGQATEVELAPDAIVRIGGLPATASDLKPGMQVPLEYGRDGKVVNAIEAEAGEGRLISGDLLESNTEGQTLIVTSDENPEGQSMQQSVTVTADAIILVDGKPAKLSDLKKGASLTLRLNESSAARAIKATNPAEEKDDNDDQ